MLILLYGLTISSFLFLKEKKHNWIIFALILCFFLWSINGQYTDFKGYYEIFERINNSGSNAVGATPGWFILCRLFGILGFNYYGMSLVLAFLSCFLLHRLFVNFDVNENVIWSILFIFPLLINGIQIRFFFTMAIVAYCLKFLIFKSNLALLKFTVGILIATAIHSASAVFFIAILIMLYEHHRKKFNIGLTIIITIGMLAGVQFIPLVAKAFLTPSQYSRYISNSYTVSSLKWVIAIVVCWLISVFIIKFLFLIVPVELKRQMKKEGSLIIYKRILRIVCILGLTLPLLIFDRNYHRYIQLGYILDALCIGIYWNKSGMKTRENLTEKILLFLCLVLVLMPAIYSFECVPVNAVAPLFKIIGFPCLLR